MPTNIMPIRVKVHISPIRLKPYFAKSQKSLTFAKIL